MQGEALNKGRCQRRAADDSWRACNDEYQVPSRAPRLGTPTPVETKAGAMPADDGLGLDDDEDIGPAGPAAVQRRPEKAVQGVQFGPRPFPFQYGDLLSEGKDFEGCVSPTAEEDADDREDGEDELRHELTCNTSQHSLTMASPWET